MSDGLQEATGVKGWRKENAQEYVGMSLEDLRRFAMDGERGCSRKLRLKHERSIERAEALLRDTG